MVRDIEQVPVEAIRVAVETAGIDDVFEIPVFRIADLKKVASLTVRIEADVEHQRGAIANDVAVVAVLDEGGVAEKLDPVPCQAKAWYQGTGIDEQVIAGVDETRRAPSAWAPAIPSAPEVWKRPRCPCLRAGGVALPAAG